MVNGERSAGQQTAIAEALWRVMSRSGPQGLTLRAVAAEAGCTTGLVTSRFPNKRALLLHARQMLHERTAARMRATAAAEPDAAKALLQVLRDAALGPEFSARIWLGYIAATLSDDELRGFQVEANRDFVEVVRGLVVRLRPAWSGERAQDEAVRIVSLVTGLAVLRSTDAELYSAEVHERLFAECVAGLAGA